MNNITLVGRISSEVSVKEFEHGKVAHFTVADNDGWNGKETPFFLSSFAQQEREKKWN